MASLTPKLLETPNIPEDIGIKISQSVVRKVQRFEHVEIVEETLDKTPNSVPTQVQDFEFR